MSHDTPPASPPAPRKVATVHATYKGAPVTLQLADASIHEVEKLIDGLLGRAHWDTPKKEHTPVQAAPSAARKPAASKVAPSYGADGEACCPVHRKPLQEGRYGWCGSGREPPHHTWQAKHNAAPHHCGGWRVRGNETDVWLATGRNACILRTPNRLRE